MNRLRDDPAWQDDDRDRICPRCDSSAPGEWDAVLRVFVCGVCSATWRPASQPRVRVGDRCVETGS
jgi:hypothetical protein